LAVALTSSRIGAFVVPMLLLAHCAAPPAIDDRRREASAPAVRPFVRRVPSRLTIRTTWAFQADEGRCVATAAAAAASLVVTIRRDLPIRLVLSLPLVPVPTAATLRFAGTAGNWEVPGGRTAAHQVTALLGADEVALSRVLVLLSGGTLDVEDPGRPVALLAIAPSASSGQRWFDCARAEMF
jgi:hypothetical protein